VLKAIGEGSVDEADLDAAVQRLLGGLDRMGILDVPEPEADLKPPTDTDKRLLRRAAAESMVLLKNDGALPLFCDSLNRIAVLGPHAVSPSIMGGGSAQVTPHHLVTPLQTLSDVCGTATEIVYERGCEIARSSTVVGGSVLVAPEGFRGEKYAGADFDGSILEHVQLDSLRMMSIGGVGDERKVGDWSMRVAGTVIPEESGILQLALAQAGTARLFIDGAIVLDGFANPAPPGGNDFFGQASQDLLADVMFERGVPSEFVVEYACRNANLAGFKVGFRTPDSDVLLERAAQAAAEADVAVVFVGTSHETESEGHDRTEFGLPGRQEELIRTVAAANDRTVVVVNAGAPVDMSWVNDVAAVIQCWFGGQEMAGALADVLVGASEPGGRLADTIPMRIEHNPSYANFPGENGEIRYGESIFMGYRGYEHSAISPRFPFGYGLSYTTFHIGEPTLSGATIEPGDPVTVSVPVTNTGRRPGTEVVQCYVAPETARLARPPKELKAFAKVPLEAGETKVVDLVLEWRSFAYWDPGQDDWPDIEAKIPEMFKSLAPAAERRARGWKIDEGRYDVLIGSSSEYISVRCSVEVPADTNGRLS
jgi:beta-glucosidase